MLSCSEMEATRPCRTPGTQAIARSARGDGRLDGVGHRAAWSDESVGPEFGQPNVGPAGARAGFTDETNIPQPRSRAPATSREIKRG